MKFAAAARNIKKNNVFTSDSEKYHELNRISSIKSNKQSSEITLPHINRHINLDSGNIHTQHHYLQELKLQKGLSKGNIKLYSIPYFFWFIGLLFILSGFILLLNLLIGIGNTEDNEKYIFNAFNEGYWWQYFIIICIVTMGISFFVVAKYETIYLNKDENRCVISKTYLMCCKVRTIELEISDIESIFPYKTGKISTATSSVVYKIGIKFKPQNKENSTCIYLFKSIFEKFVVDDVKRLREFVYELIEDYDSIKEEMRNGIDYS